MKIEFFNSEPYVTLDCTYAEQEQDTDNQCLLDKFTTRDIEVKFDYDYFDFEDLILLIYSKIQELDIIV